MLSFFNYTVEFAFSAPVLSGLFIVQGKSIPVHQLSPNVNPLDTAKRPAAPEQFKSQGRDHMDPILRGNLFPKVSGRACRQPLPTLFCGPWRPHAITGSIRGANKSVVRLFKCSWERIGHLE